MVRTKKKKKPPKPTLSTKGRFVNPRVGTRGGDYMMPISFSSGRISTAMIRDVQSHYRTGYFSQREIADHYQLSYSLIAKICRIAKENGGEVISK